MQLGRRRVAMSNFESRRLTVPKARDLSSKDDREAAQFAVKIRRVSFRSSANKQTEPMVLSCLSHSSDFQGLTTSRGDVISACGGRRDFICAPLIARFLPC